MTHLNRPTPNIQLPYFSVHTALVVRHKKYLLSFKEERTGSQPILRYILRITFVLHLKKSTTITLIPRIQMGYNQMQSFGGISHLVKFTKGEMMFYIQLWYIIYGVHAIIITDKYWMARLFIKLKEYSGFLKSICGITIKIVKILLTCPSFSIKK